MSVGGRHRLVPALVTLALALVVCMAAGCGDPAPSPLTQAALAMQGLRGYTFEGDVTAGASSFHIAGVFNAPDRIAVTVTPRGAAPTRVVVIGTRSFELKPGSSGWTAAPGPVSGGIATDPRSAFTAVAQSEQVSSDANRYTFKVAGPAAVNLVQGSVAVTGTANLNAGRIVGLAYRSDQPAVNVDLVYAAFNNPPLVTPPVS